MNMAAVASEGITVDRTNKKVSLQPQKRKLAVDPLTQTVDKTKDVVAGPFLNLSRVNAEEHKWDYSTVVVHRKTEDLANLPTLQVGDRRFNATVLSQEKDVTILRYQFTVDQEELEKETNYSLADKNFTIYTPAKESSPRMMAYSCNGTQYEGDEEKAGGFDGPWNQFLDVHKKSHHHVMLGGGDQIYCDAVWDLPALQEWVKMSREDKIKAPFTQEMREQVEAYYLNHYLNHLSRKSYAEAQGQVAQVNQWDDHDIFDGFGSFPPDVQDCEVFKEIFGIAQKYYRIFQQHKTVDEYAGGLIPNTSTTLHNFGKMSVLGLDTRTERTHDQIIAESTYETIFEQLRNLPEDVDHVVIMASVPLAYPGFSIVDEILDLLSNLAGDELSSVANRLRGGVAQLFGLKNDIGTVDLRDDAGDHWNHHLHKKELIKLIETLQSISKEKDIRFSFLSGDVHAYAMGEFNAASKVQGLVTRVATAVWGFFSSIVSSAWNYLSGTTPKEEKVTLPEQNPYLMKQFVSSPMTNVPAPEALVAALRAKGNTSTEVGENTVAYMTDMYEEGRDEPGPSIVSGRNFLSLEEIDQTSELKVRIYAENKDAGPTIYAATVPVLRMDGVGGLERDVEVVA